MPPLSPTQPYPTLARDSTFAPESRVWIYTANRRLNATEADLVQQQLDAFTQRWTAHDRALLAKGELFDHQFLILSVDETHADASGCSIDSSVHFLEDLGQQIGVDWFERMRFGWVDTGGHLQVSSRDEFAELRQSGTITDSTLVLNTLVATQHELSDRWLVPFAQSWHRRLF